MAHLCTWTLYMKLALFWVPSLFKRGAGAAWRGGCMAGWNWTASTHYCKHHPTRQARRSQGSHTRRGLSAKTHPLKPKLLLIYMFRLFKTATSTESSLPPSLPASITLHLHTQAYGCNWTQGDYFFSCSSLRNKIHLSHHQGQNNKGRPQWSDKL